MRDLQREILLRALFNFHKRSPVAPSASAEATADESTPATGTSGKIPSAVSSTHAVQTPRGASEKIFAPHLRQILVTLIMARDSACVPILYCVKFCQRLRPP